ncbi:MAG: sugar phosphate isomerase/epimerase [Clostridiales bacterium]|nr:sugar phosphate isomerase/epimerase [Clostridiales bacterium]
MTDKLRCGIICALEELDPAYPVTLRGDMRLVTEEAVRAGFEAIEWHIRNPLQYDGKALREAAKKRGLATAAVSTGLEYVLNGLSLTSDDETVRGNALGRLKEHIDFAEKIECPTVIIGSMRGNIPDSRVYDSYEGRLTDAVLELSNYAEKSGVCICVEAINRKWTNYLCSVPETLRYVEKVGRPNFRIHIDTYQMNEESRIEEPPPLPSDLGEEVKMCAGRLGHVHFSDDNRRVPGEGNIDFLPVLRALHEISYDGFAVMETVGYPLGGQAVKMSLEMLRGLEAGIAKKR